MVHLLKSILLFELQQCRQLVKVPLLVFAVSVVSSFEFASVVPSTSDSAVALARAIVCLNPISSAPALP